MQYVQAAFYFMGWLQRASMDGKVTATEIAEIVEFIVSMFGIEIEVDKMM